MPGINAPPIGAAALSPRNTHDTYTRQIVDLETELNDRVYALFGLTDEEQMVINQSTKYEEGAAWAYFSKSAHDPTVWMRSTMLSSVATSVML